MFYKAKINYIETLRYKKDCNFDIAKFNLSWSRIKYINLTTITYMYIIINYNKEPKISYF